MDISTYYYKISKGDIEKNIMGWRNRPKFINYCPKWTEYVLFIDENGSSDMETVAKNFALLTPNQELLTITGIALKACDLIKAKEKILGLKFSYWQDGCLNMAIK
jgi:hypothetical protein